MGSVTVSVSPFFEKIIAIAIRNTRIDKNEKHYLHHKD